MFVDIAESAKPSIVHVTSERRPLKDLKNKMEEEEFLKKFPYPWIDPESFRSRAAGSGIIMSQDGYILTNNHLVEGSEKIRVKITNSDSDRGKEYDGTVVGRDEATDLAVIKIDPEEPLPAAKLGDSSKLKVGQWAIAIGDPFGIEKTVTVGVISGLGRSNFGAPLRRVRYQNFIQTDASINPGNSGGPLLNIDGEVLGRNTFIQAQGRGISFAIPIEMAKEVYAQIIEHGEVIRGFLGVGIGDLNEGLAAAMGAPDMKGALVDRVFPDTPAEQAGLRHGDIIREVDGQTLENSKELQNIISHKRPGDKVNIALLRKGKKEDFTIELMKFPEQIAAAEKPKKRHNLLGLKVDKIPDNLRQPGEKGVYIAEIRIDSPADEGGLSEGDIILEIDMQEVGGVEEFREIVDKLEPGQWVSLYIRRGEATLYRALKIPADEE
jgi:Do/DeqQ family serine protease